MNGNCKLNKENLNRDGISREDGQTEKEEQGDAPIRDGGANNSTEKKFVVGANNDQETGGDPGDIFGRRPRILRTPPMRKGTGSLPDEQRLEVEITRLPRNAEVGGAKDREKEKRKRTEDSPVEGKESSKETLKESRDNSGRVWGSEYCENPKEENESDKTSSNLTGGDKEYAKINELSELIISMIEEIKDLRKVVNRNQNTKVEIKKSSLILEELAVQLEEEEYLTKLRELIEKSAKNDVLTARKEEGRKDISRVCAGTQTEREPWKIRNEQTVERIRYKIGKCDDLNEVMEVVNVDWPEEVFRVTRKTNGNPIWDNNERDIAILARGENILEAPIGRQISTRFPEFLDAPTRTEQVYSVLYEAKTKTQEGKICRSRRTITAVKMDEDEGKTFQALLKWKQNAAELGVKRVAIPAIGNDGERMRKLIECVFWGTDMTIMWYDMAKKKQSKGAKTRATVDHKGDESSRRLQKKRRKYDAVVVKAKGKSFADLLKGVKEKVDVSKLGINITGARSTKEGNLLLTMEKGEGTARTLKEEISKRLGEEQVEVREGGEKSSILHIKGLEATTTAMEVKTAIKAAIGNLEGNVEVKSMRPAFADRQNATVEVESKTAENLVALGRLRVGWAICTVQKRIGIARCVKCWGVDHRTRECTGMDRTALCLKCAQEGHRVRECQNEPFCPICTKRGHRADSMRCPIYREAVRVMEKTARRRQEDPEDDPEDDRRRGNTPTYDEEEEVIRDLNQTPQGAGPSATIDTD